MKISQSRLTRLVSLGLLGLATNAYAETLYSSISVGGAKPLKIAISHLNAKGQALSGISLGSYRATNDTNYVYVSVSGVKPGANFSWSNNLGITCKDGSFTCSLPISALKNSSAPTLNLIYRQSTAYLLLHGMNSGSGVWNAVASGIIQKRWSNACMGVSTTLKPSAMGNENVRCFAWQAAEKKAKNSRTNGDQMWKSGDALTFGELGAEVTQGLKDIQTAYPGIGSFVLVGHSRGGLAARASFAINDPIVQKVRGVVQVGTPNQGSVLGRLNQWMLTNPRPSKWGSCTTADGQPEHCTTPGLNGMASERDRYQTWWQADAAALTGTDVGSPTVGYLAIGSNELNKLNNYKLPAWVKPATVTSTGIPLGQVTGMDGKPWLGIDLITPKWGVMGQILPWKLPDATRRYALSGFSISSGQAGLSTDGDGIVHIQSQAKLLATNTVINYPVSKVHHADEPSNSMVVNAIMTALSGI